MILLILGWHLALFGFFAVIFELLFSAPVWCLLGGIIFCVPGLILVMFLGKTCPADEKRSEKSKVPLDYY